MAKLVRKHAGIGGEEGWGRTIVVGAAAGLVASIVMAMFAMIAAATYQDTGFFTAMYHIASPVIGGESMTASMEAAAGGDLFTFDGGPALLGLAIHMAWGVFWGIVFFGLARAVHVRGAPAFLAAGIVYGLAVMLVMSWITLPITASVVGGGKPIEDMPTVVGWGTFSVEHALFGLVLGVWGATRGRRAGEQPATVQQRRLVA